MDKVQIGAQSFIGIMPAVLVGANVNGKANFMTAAWASVACMTPPMMCVAINHNRHTALGIEANGAFSLNIPSAKQVVETDYCGITSGARVDKSKVFDVFYGKLVTAPMAGNCPVNIECSLFKEVDCGSHILYIGAVTEVYVNKECVADGKPDIQKIDPIIYTSGSNYWQLGKNIGKGFSIGKSYRKK